MEIDCFLFIYFTSLRDIVCIWFTSLPDMHRMYSIAREKEPSLTFRQIQNVRNKLYFIDILHVIKFR